MTNEEKHKTPEERAEAFRKFCNSSQCNECECSKDGKKLVALCEFGWLALEAKKELLSARSAIIQARICITTASVGLWTAKLVEPRYSGQRRNLSSPHGTGE